MRKKLDRSRAFGECRPPEHVYFLQDGLEFDKDGLEIRPMDRDPAGPEPEFTPGEPINWKQPWYKLRKEIEMRTGMKPENKLHAEELAKTACLFE